MKITQEIEVGIRIKAILDDDVLRVTASGATEFARAKQLTKDADGKTVELPEAPLTASATLDVPEELVKASGIREALAKLRDLLSPQLATQALTAAHQHRLAPGATPGVRSLHITSGMTPAGGSERRRAEKEGK